MVVLIAFILAVGIIAGTVKILEYFDDNIYCTWIEEKYTLTSVKKVFNGVIENITSSDLWNIKNNTFTIGDLEFVFKFNQIWFSVEIINHSNRNVYIFWNEGTIIADGVYQSLKRYIDKCAYIPFDAKIKESITLDRVRETNRYGICCGGYYHTASYEGLINSDDLRRSLRVDIPIKFDGNKRQVYSFTFDLEDRKVVPVKKRINKDKIHF